VITMIREDIKIINGGACGVLSLGNLFSIFIGLGIRELPDCLYLYFVPYILHTVLIRFDHFTEAYPEE
jgi:hypothetical protein